MSTGDTILKRKLSAQVSSPSILFKYMGIYDWNQDPTTAQADWDKVLRRLKTHPHEARSICGLSYPLNFALCNRSTPVTAAVVDTLIECYPDALMEEDIGNACRNKNTYGETIHVLIIRARRLLGGREIFKRWDLDWIACNDNKQVAKVLINTFSKTDLQCVLNWKEIRSCHHTFWFSLLLDTTGSSCGLKDHIQQDMLLQVFIFQGNYTIVKLILNTYPDLIRKTCCWTGNRNNQLPLHIALSEEKPNQYRSWHKRSKIVRLLLEYGVRFHVGGNKACGGLWSKDSHQDAFSYAIESAINCPGVDIERKRCLQVCLQFAQASLYNKPLDAVDYNLPILHACIGVVSLETFSAIIQKYGCSILKETDEHGSTALFHLISMASERPAMGYIATRNVMEMRKKLFQSEIHGHIMNLNVMSSTIYLTRVLRSREQEMFEIQPSLNCFDFVTNIPGCALTTIIDLKQVRRLEEYEIDDIIIQLDRRRPLHDFNFDKAVTMYDEYMNIRGTVHAGSTLNGSLFASSDSTRMEKGPRTQLEHDSHAHDDDRAVLNEEDGDIDDEELRIDMTSDEERLLRERVLDKIQELDINEEHLIERTYFTCICNILLMTGHSQRHDETMPVNMAKMKNYKGMLPLHEAALRHAYIFEQVLASYRGALSQPVTETLLFPFAISAACPHGSLDFTFRLLLEQPNVFDEFIGT